MKVTEEKLKAIVMKKLFFIFILAIAYLLYSCASIGFDRGQIKEDSQIKVQIDDAEIEKNLSQKPQVKFPIRIGVYLMEGNNSKHWRFDSTDKQSLLSIEEGLIKKGVVSQIFYISESIGYVGTSKDYATTKKGEYTKNQPLDLKKIRRLASKYGADCVLLVKGGNYMEEDSNVFSILYATIIGLWIVPGSIRNSLFVVNASMWDVRNEFLYLTAEAEAEEKITRPYGFLNEKDLIKRTKDKAFESLKIELEKRISNLKASASGTL
ncbi:MAG: hypothetical protein H7A23_18520 [Leptospiraceae bacterium]|nr:hypothetical protein [Leptospiraceae bacterium]MCP5496546.1 hypothetical protein [Leptospiraceae bacterium]